MNPIQQPSLSLIRCYMDANTQWILCITRPNQIWVAFPIFWEADCTFAESDLHQFELRIREFPHSHLCREKNLQLG